MIKLKHNITKDLFERIYCEPNNSDIPPDLFVRKDGEKDIIKRTITLTYLTKSDTVTITCFRKLIEEEKEYLQKYTFAIIDHENKSGEFDDGYVHISVQGAQLLKPKVSEPWLAEKGIEEIKKFGYNAAKNQYAIWREYAKDESEEIPMDKNGNFDEEEFCNQLNDSLWELGFEEMERRPSLAKALDFCGTDRVGYAFFDGVYQFLNSHTSPNFIHCTSSLPSKDSRVSR